MIEAKELGLKIAESPREALIKDTIENTKKRILQLQVTLELEENALKFLEGLK
jgi:hypothetical protein